MYLTKNKCNELFKREKGAEIEYEGKKYLIVEHAELTENNYGNIKDVYYDGKCVLLQDILDIVNGGTQVTFEQEEKEYELDDYTIEWDIYDEYLEEDGEGNTVFMIDDEQDACDWDHPRKITKNL